MDNKSSDEDYEEIINDLKKLIKAYEEDGRVAGILRHVGDIAYLQRIETELRIAREQTQAANQAKREFIANMSHDIRTPLAGLIGLSEMLTQSLKNPQEREKARLLHDSGEQLLHMLNDILDEVRADNFNEKDIKKQSFDLHLCIHELIRLESPVSTLKNLQLKVNIAPNVPRYIYSDRNKIYRILLNLLDNAIKFTQFGSITVELECLHRDETKAHLKFSVSDTGIGIPKDAQAQVFNRFFKVGSAYNAAYRGHGLGLHIVQSYVELLGGHITLTSKEGFGSAFSFDLECGLSIEPQPVVDLQHSNKKTSLELQREHFHLLLVEDNVIALKTLEFLLAQKGHTFSAASTAKDAFALFQEQEFDLIILDLGLPDSSGLKLTQLIRSQENGLNNSSIPIIGLTGHTDDATREECIKRGMNEVFPKPAQIENLDRCMQKLKQKMPSKYSLKSLLGFDEEEKLFQLDSFGLFSEAEALKQISDKQLLINLLQAYLSDHIQEEIQLLAEYHAEQNWEEVEKIAHKIKGGVAYLGTQKMYHACQYLERYYKAGQRSLLEPLYQQLLKVNEETSAELTRWLQQQA